MKVKICGITNKDDAVWAINYGADFLGLNFYKESPRHISLASAAKWVSELPPFASAVGVFVNEEPTEVVKAVAKLKLKGIQLHGEESPEMMAALRVSLSVVGHPVFIMKAFRVQDEHSLVSMSSYTDVVDYFLLDAWADDQPGGTGTRFDWDLALKAKELGKPIFLAGGLTADNVREAVKKVAPFAVDVASGVEKSPKRKDLKKMQDFIANAKK